MVFHLPHSISTLMCSFSPVLVDGPRHVGCIRGSGVRLEEIVEIEIGR